MNLAQSFHLLSTAVFVLGSAVVGVALMRLAARTRELPEFLLGMAILGAAVLGYGVLIASQVVRAGLEGGEVTSLAIWLSGVGRTLHAVGVSSFLFFVVYVFRKNDRWAHVVAGTFLAMLWGGLAWGAVVDDSFRNAAVRTSAWWVEYAVIWTYQLWITAEAITYWVMMRRRQRIGVGDPMLTNRFALWGSASVFCALSIWFASAPVFLVDQPELLAATTPAFHYATAFAGLVSITCNYLAFLPPDWYVHRIQAGAAQPT